MAFGDLGQNRDYQFNLGGLALDEWNPRTKGAELRGLAFSWELE